MALIDPSRLHWTYAFTTLFGIGTAVTTVIPSKQRETLRLALVTNPHTVAALALSVPSFLLGAAGTLSISCRAFGGIIGITAFTAIHSNKFAAELPKEVAGALLATKAVSPKTLPAMLGEVLGALSNQALPPPTALEAIQPPLSKSTIGAILGAMASAQTLSWKWVWVAIAAIVALNAAVVCTARPVRERMNDHIESALEASDARSRQISGKQ